MSKIVFMGTPAFAVPTLQQLIEMAQVVGVVTQPDRPAGRGKKLQASPVKLVAENAGIPLYQPKSVRKAGAIEPIRQWQPEIIIVAAFGQILPARLLALPAHGCLNIHASLLPRWRGASPIHHAILAGDAQTGISLMQMDEGLDTGGVFVQEAVTISPEETAESLHDRLALLGATMLESYLSQIIACTLPPIPQDDTNATYAPRIKKEDGLLDWGMPASYLHRKIRAMTPWPQCFTQWQGQTLKILAAKLHTEKMPALSAGTVFSPAQNEKNRAVVQTGDGGLELLSLQLPGKKAVPIADFLRGKPNLIGTQLGF